MLLTVKEMEVLCIFHDGDLSSTLELLRRIKAENTGPPSRMADIDSLIEKLSKMNSGDRVCIAFDSER
ncbi:MAG: hypothetical protein FWE20_13115 [Defluviitaleaceae bacterium]|nr:hypothetical protein [Defluviitaleaceae bacterium]